MDKPLKTFWGHVIKTSSCWVWNGYTYRGYGMGTKVLGEKYSHRISYVLAKGEIPKGLQIDHLCRNRACVNPDHLEAVTAEVNKMRGEGVCARNARKNYCKRGHPFDTKNTELIPGGRRCIECHNKHLYEKEKAV